MHPILQYAQGKLDEAIDDFKRSGGDTAQWQRMLIAMFRYQQVYQITRHPDMDSRLDDALCSFCCNMGKPTSWVEQAKIFDIIPKDFEA